MKKKKANRLIYSKSPYLLQHAYNPVDWYEWGDEAFETAKREDKPIFLSIGYSTCHWCHVMEEQSFENEEIAALMNLSFVNIKVDREERPDIDSVYMTVCQMLTGSGGWPLTIIMTPDKKPFFAGTYFPPATTMGRIGMIDLINRINDIWKNKRELALTSANDIVDKLNEPLDGQNTVKVNKSVLHGASNTLSANYDEEKGGFSKAPKFPIPHNISFLLRYHKMTNSNQVLMMANKTLDEMRLGGIFDQIGYGFHRYSTDANWLLPHFEKMLYDQAGLLMAYTEAYQISRNELYKTVAGELVEYLENELISEAGGFYSAEDADSEGVEGKFYVWTTDEIRKVLKEDAERFIKIFNMKDDGNYFDETGEYNSSMNIPYLNDVEFLTGSEQSFVTKSRKKLFDVREKRVHPFKDDKILSDWNGFMLAALAKAGFVFNNEKYISLAEKAADFLLDNLFDKKRNILLHRYRDGDAAIEGTLDDYAFLSYGLMELYFATGNIKYFDWYIKLMNQAIDLFYDKELGGFFLTSSTSELVLKRQKDLYDGAMPSGNSIMMLNLIRLQKITNNHEIEIIINKTLDYFSAKLMQYPSGYTMFLNSLFLLFHKSSEIVIAGSRFDENYESLIEAVRKSFLPFSVIIYLDEKRDMEKYSEWTKFIPIEKDKTTAYFCENYACQSPTSESEAFYKMLNQ